MDTIAAFFLKSIVASGVLFSYYRFFLRNRKFHQYNRFYLLLTLIIPVAIPFFNFKLYNLGQPLPSALNSLSTGIISNAATRQPALFGWASIIYFIEAGISLVLLFILLSKIAWIYKIKRRHSITRMHGCNFIETELEQAPFSFLNNLFWKKSISLEDENGGRIFTHELTHIRERHTYDKLFSQVMLCFFWMNPFYWLIQKELNVVHEFIADSRSIQDGDAESFARMLLQSHNGGRYLNPSHSFFHSSIKRRLIMITTSKNTRYSYLRRVLVLPIVSLVVIFFSFSVAKAQNDPKSHPGPVNIQKVTITKRPANGKDSIADVKIEYLKPDSTPAVLNVTATYENARVNNDPVQKQKPVLYNEETGERTEPTPAEVQQLLIRMIQNPPAGVIYYVDGKETAKEKIKKLDPLAIKTMDIFHNEDAVKRYGEKAKNGVVVLTTK